MNGDLQDQFGAIDIYLFDQLLKGRFDHCQHILDIGCGSGRNLVYFLRQRRQVFGIDADPAAIASVQKLAADLDSGNPPDHFKVGLAEQLPYKKDYFDLVISSAVLHFARDPEHFNQMVNSAWHVLKPGGFMFARLASSIGIEEKIIPLGPGRYALPDQSVRYLVNEQILLDYTVKLGGKLFESLKTTNVQGQRCMTTWCIQKNYEL